MRKFVVRYGIALVLVAGVILSAGGPAAARPTAGGGTFMVVSDTQNVVGQAGGNLMITEVLGLEYETGPLRGPATDSDTFVAHADGSFEGHGFEVCTGCTVGTSASGEFLAVFTFRGAGDTYSGHLEIISAEGGLSGLRGGGSFAGTISTNVNSYDYRLATHGRP